MKDHNAALGVCPPFSDALPTQVASLEGKCVGIATHSKAQASKELTALGFEPVLLLDRFDCTRGLSKAVRSVRADQLDTAIVHSADWSRQPLQRLYEVALLRMPVSRRFVADATCLQQLSRASLLGATVHIPPDVLEATIATSREAIVALRKQRRRPSLRFESVGSVMAIWRGDPAIRAGGSVTHAAGMLGAFRAHGLRVGLVAACDPPAQIAENIDDLEVARPLPPSKRLTREIEQLCLNAPLRLAAANLLGRLQPRFIYQRYEAFLTAGLDLAAQAGLPLILEWNGSEDWVRANWQPGHVVKHPFNPLLRSIERRSLREATLVRAISHNAAQAATALAGPALRLEVIPNGVDIDRIPFVHHTPGTATAATLGWVGSFGPWHGAELVVEALARLPDDVHAVMIGDGPGRPECQRLAVETGVADRVRWTGLLPHDEAVAVLAACDVLVSPHVPSESQPFFGSPTKIFEYMAIGRPIVASSLEQIAEILADGRTAQLVRPGDPARLAEGIAAVLARPDRGTGLGHRARSDAEKHHSWYARVEVLLRSLNALAGPALN
jgi:glycosyltransferase involved in cell wall biosynthesis